ncbi:urease subunit beta [Streptomyces sp. NPDC001515]
MPYFQPLAPHPTTPAQLVCPGPAHCGHKPGNRPPSGLDPSETGDFSRHRVGEVWVKDPDAEIELNSLCARATVYVVNVGDRDIQIGSHFHLADVNEDLLFFTDLDSATQAEAVLTDPGLVRDAQIAAARALAYDRSKTPGKAPWGYRLDVAPGDSKRFSPENAPSEAVDIVAIRNRRRVPGLRKDKSAADVELG